MRLPRSLQDMTRLKRTRLQMAQKLYASQTSPYKYLTINNFTF